MIKLLIVASLALIPFAALADNTNINSSGSSSSSSSGANVGVISGTSSYGSVSNTISNPSDLSIKGTPSLGSLALGGSDPCGLSPLTAQFSILGGGAGIGGMQESDSCMLMLMGLAGNPQAMKAAEIMIAGRSAEACSAMEAAGMVICYGSPKWKKALGIK